MPGQLPWLALCSAWFHLWTRPMSPPDKREMPVAKWQAVCQWTFWQTEGVGKFAWQPDVHKKAPQKSNREELWRFLRPQTLAISTHPSFAAYCASPRHLRCPTNGTALPPGWTWSACWFGSRRVWGTCWPQTIHRKNTNVVGLRSCAQFLC